MIPILTALKQSVHPQKQKNRSYSCFLFDVLVFQVPPSSGSAQGSTTPNSSISNMACLPEGDNLSNSVTGTPSPPPAPTLSAMASTTAIYARVNPNLKRDKTNNNNFTSTFTTPPAASTQQPQRPEAVTSSINTHSALGGNGENRMGK